MDVFNVQDRDQILSGNPGFGGVGAIIGLYTTSKLIRYGIIVGCVVYAFGTLLNVLSMPERSLPSLRDNNQD